MEKDNVPFQDNKELEENIIQNETPQKKFPLWVKILIPLIAWWLIIIIIVIIVSKSSDESSEKYFLFKGVYDISPNIDTNIISSEFLKDKKIDMKINGTKHNCTYSIHFTKPGLTNIEFFVYQEEINLDGLFKNIYSLISV